MNDKTYAHDAHCNTTHEPGPQECPPAREPDDPADAQQTNEALDWIADPARILATAMARALEADRLHEELFGPSAGTQTRGYARQESALAMAAAYTGIAEAAMRLHEHERLSDVPSFSDLSDPDGPVWNEDDDGAQPAYVPQAVQGVRFTARPHPADGQYLGYVSGRAWLHLPGHGFIDVTDCHQVHDSGVYEMTGRIVSATPAHILGITDGGVPVALPRALVVESPDE